MGFWIGFSCAVLLLTVCGCAERELAQPRPLAGKLVLQGVTVVDTRSGKLQPKRSVFLEGGRIVAIEPTNGAAPDPAAQVVDARGKFVVPGYNDLHAHVLGPDDPSASLALMLANGITGFRQMQGSDDLLEQRRAGTLPIGRDAPELLAMPGPILTPLNAGSEAEVVATVREQKAAGADFIKAGFTGGPVFMAGLAEAVRLGIPYVGHVPRDASVIAASEAGMTSMEHLGPGDGIIVACSRDESVLRAEIAELPVVSGPPVKLPFMEWILSRQLAKRILNPVAGADAAGVARTQRAVDTYDEGRCQKVAAGFAARGTWQVPTLIRLRTTELGDSPEFPTDPNLRFMAPQTVESWREVTASFAENQSPAAKQTFRESYALQQKLVKLLDAAGVKMMAGSDVSGAWLVPGFSLHQEFDELEKAGLRPLTVLQMTTVNGAEFFGRKATMGTVEPGKNADLVLLDANPLASVQNLHKIDAVVRAGFYYSNADLEALKAGARVGEGPRP